jgi:hypothetical protein
MAKRPTESDLDIEVTPEEIAQQNAPPVDDDIPLADDIPEETGVAEPEAQTDREKADAAERARSRDGKFVRAEKPVAEVPPPGFVSQAALREAREENKTIMSRLATLLEIQAARDAKANAPKVEAPVIPDKNVDPLAYMDHIDQRLAKFEQVEQQTVAQRQAQEREQADMVQVLNVARPQYEEAARADPTVPAVYKELLDGFGRELMFINQHNPEFMKDQRGFLQRELSKIENAHIKHAVATGQNVAQYMRALAQSRGVNMTGAPAQQQNGQQSAPQPPARSIEERQQQQQRHISLGDAPGGEAPKTLDAKTLAKMSNKEFAAFAKTMKEEDLDAMMGGRG